jgi:hypothetical protein
MTQSERGRIDVLLVKGHDEQSLVGRVTRLDQHVIDSYGKDRLVAELALFGHQGKENGCHPDVGFLHAERRGQLLLSRVKLLRG